MLLFLEAVFKIVPKNCGDLNYSETSIQGTP